MLLVLGSALLQGCPDSGVDDPSALAVEASNALLVGDRARAEQLLHRAVRAAPKVASLRWELAQVYYSNAKFEFAESHLRAALEHGMSPSAAMPLLARSLLANGDLTDLLTMDLTDTLTPSARAQVLAYKSQAAQQINDMEQARNLLAQARIASDDEPAVGVAEARMLIAEGNLRDAEDTLRHLLDRVPSEVDALGSLADLCRDSGRLVEAEQLYGRALAQRPGQINLHFLRAEVRLDLGDAVGAAEDTVAIEVTAPHSFAALYPRARLLLLNREVEEALAAFQAAGELMPTHPGDRKSVV